MDINPLKYNLSIRLLVDYSSAKYIKVLKISEVGYRTSEGRIDDFSKLNLNGK